MVYNRANSNKKIGTSQRRIYSETENAVFKIIKSFKGSWSWEGTMSSLRDHMCKSKILTKQEKSLLPGSPSALRVVINRMINRLRSNGVKVRFFRSPDVNRHRLVSFR